MLAQLGIQGILGAATGYATNSLAISMLFKRYFGCLGGFIEDHHESFVENLAVLVERDLVKHETLAETCASDDFRAVLRAVVEETLAVELPRQVDGMRLADLPGGKESLGNLAECVAGLAPGPLDELFDILLSKPLSALVSDRQFVFFTRRLAEAGFAGKADFKLRVEQALASFLGRHTFGELISKPALERLRLNLEATIRETDLSAFERDIRNTLEHVLRLVDLPGALAKAWRNLEERSPAEFARDPEALSRGLLDRFASLARGAEGREALVMVCDAIVQEAETIPVKLADLLAPNVGEALSRFIREKLPPILTRVADFIRANRKAIETIVNQAVDEELGMSMYGRIVRFVKNLFIENLSRKYALVERLVGAVEEHGDEAGEKLSAALADFLETKPLGEIVKAVRAHGLLNGSLLATLVQNNIAGLKNSGTGLLDPLLRTPLKDLLEGGDWGGLTAAIGTRLEDAAVAGIVEPGPIRCALARMVGERLAGLDGEKAGGLIPPGGLTSGLDAPRVQAWLDRQWPRLAGVELAAILPDELPSADWPRWFADFGEWRFDRLCATLCREPVYAAGEAGLVDLLETHLERLLEGNVSEAVKIELGKANPSDICGMVKDFMGRELRPINLIGAGLGACAGTGYALATSLFNAPGGFVYATPAIFAGTGYLTNRLAIAMLFRPYEKKWWLPNALVGVVPRNKPEFARRISRFVKRETLNEAVLKRFYIERKEACKADLAQRLAADDYRLVERILTTGYAPRNLAGHLCQAIGTLARQDTRKIADFGAEKLEATLQTHCDEWLPEVNRRLIDALDGVEFVPWLHVTLEKQRGRTLPACLADAIGTRVGDLCRDDVRRLPDRATFAGIKRWIGGFDADVERFSAESTVRDLCGDSFLADLAGRMAAWISDMARRENAGNILIDYLRKPELRPEAKLGEVFGNALSRLVEENIADLTDIAIDEIAMHRGAITAGVADELPGWCRCLLGWRKLIEGVVDRLVDRDLPTFLRGGEMALKDLFADVLNFRLADLGFDEHWIQPERLRSALADFVDTPPVRRGAERTLRIFVRGLGVVPLRMVFELLGVTRIEALVEALEPSLAEPLADILERFADENAEIAERVGSLAGRVVAQTAARTSCSKLLSGIDLEAECEGLFAAVKADETLRRDLSEALLGLLSKLAHANDFLSPKVLRKDLAGLAATLFGDDWQAVEAALAPCLEALIRQLNAKLEPETKDAMSGIFLGAALEAVEPHLDAALGAVDIEGLIEREISRMHPRDVEAMFEAFAGDYFKTLRRYGLWGGVAGLVPLAIHLFAPR